MLLTTAQLARKLGVSLARVHQLARARRVRPATKVGGAFLWSSDCVRSLKPRKPGRPKAK